MSGMVYDLRARLFEHIESLGLQHHITSSVGDAVYRVDVDAWAIENLVMSGIFPLASSITTREIEPPAATWRFRFVSVAR